MDVPTLARGLRRAAAVSAALLVACESGTGNEEQRIAITLTPTSGTIGQGASVPIVVTIARTRYEGTVDLSIVGTLPEGVTATFSADPIAATGQSSTLTLAASGAAAPGTFTVTVRAAGQNVADVTADVSLTVNVTGNFSLATAEPSLTVSQGGGGNATVLVQRASGNMSSVTLAASGLPTGVTATFGQSPTTQSGTTMAFVASGSVTPGTYPVTITGTAAGLGNQTTQLSLVVIAPPSTAALSVPFCAGSLPAWFAYQNRGFPWQRVTPTGNSFNFNATDRVAIAYTFVFGGESQVNVFFATRAELAAFNDRDCDGTKSLNGTVAGVATGQVADLYMGAATASVPGNGAFQLTEIQARPLDLAAVRGFVNGNFFTGDRLIIRRGLDLPTGTTIPQLDFAAAESFAPVLNNLTINGTVSGDVVDFQNNLWSATSTFAVLHSAQVGTATPSYYAIPSAQLAAADLHELTISATQPGGLSGHTLVSYFGAPGTRTETLGPLLTTPTLTTIASNPYARVKGTLPSQADYPSLADFFMLQGGLGSRRFILLVQTADYVGATPAQWEMVVPDFSGTDGFNSSWMFQAGQPTAFAAEAFAGRSTIPFGALPVAGDVVKLSFRESQTTLPALRAADRDGRGILLRSRQYLRR